MKHLLPLLAFIPAVALAAEPAPHPVTATQPKPPTYEELAAQNHDLEMNVRVLQMLYQKDEQMISILSPKPAEPAKTEAKKP